MKAVMAYAGDFTFEEEHVSRFRERFPDVEFVCKPREALADGDLDGAEAFVGWPTDAELAAMPQLRWIQLPSAGANGYVDHRTLPQEVAITTSSGVFGVPGAEHAIALILAFTRQLHVHMRQQSERVWRRNPHCLEVQDATVAVIGLGDIGKEIARKAKGLGAYVIGVKRSPSAPPEGVDELRLIGELDDVLARADFVVAALPLSDDTRRLIDAGRIARMKQGAVFINVGRGPTVDEAALIEALADGRLEGAGLDVTDVEPLPADSPLWSMPNVLITSHSVGVSPKKAERRTALYLDNFERFLAGKPLRNQVDRMRGY